MLTPPRQVPLKPWSQMPAALRNPRRSAWGDLNFNGRALGCFLEGPVFDEAGDLLVVDIPFGRIFRIDPGGAWSLLADYDGWPNGMKLSGQRLLIADHKLGLVELDPRSGEHEIIFSGQHGMPLLGLNDLTFGPSGELYMTDQGQSGLHDPCGRVLRRSPDGEIAVVLDTCPSPNGLVFDAARNWLYVAMTRGNAIWRVPLVDGRPTKVGLAIQLSGGIGPDGLALDPAGRLLAVQAPIGVWQFDANNQPLCFYAAPPDSYVTNLAVARHDGGSRMIVIDSINGRLLVADLEDFA